MATLTTAYVPFAGRHGDYTLPRCDYLSTSGSGATNGGIEIFADPAVSDNFFLTSLDVSFLAPSAAAIYTTYIGKTKLATYPTIAANALAHYHHSFGVHGAGSGTITTTTATVSIVGNGASSVTVQFFATGYRLI